jgi:hypothetical protein
MVFSFAVAILVASTPSPASRVRVFWARRRCTVAGGGVHGRLHAAFYALVIFMVIAAVLSGLRAGRGGPVPRSGRVRRRSQSQPARMLSAASAAGATPLAGADLVSTRG